MSALCGERELIDGYNLRTDEFPKGRDFYAMLASSAFNMDYWDCTEFRKDGSFNQEGKNRRQAGKVIQLGVSYGMGVKLLVDGLNAKKNPGEKKMTVDEGQEMMDTFFGRFKTLKNWKDYNMEKLEHFGYMETALGRRRRLYDTWLPDYEIHAMKETPIEDVFFDLPRVIIEEDIERTKEIENRMKDMSSFEKKDFVADLEMDPMNRIKNNGGFKSRPKTQATNFTIQGGSAELTKRALVAIYNHPERERLGLNILAPVHDEILVEANTKDRKEALRVLLDCMINSAKGLYEVKMACDGVIETHWNLEHFTDKIQKEYKKNNDLEKLYDNHPEVDKDCLKRMALGEFDVETERLIPRK